MSFFFDFSVLDVDDIDRVLFVGYFLLKFFVDVSLFWRWVWNQMIESEDQVECMEVEMLFRIDFYWGVFLVIVYFFDIVEILLIFVYESFMIDIVKG